MTELQTMLPILKRFAAVKQVEIEVETHPSKQITAGKWGDTRETAGKWIAEESTRPGYTEVVLGDLHIEFDLDGQLAEAYAYDEC